MKIVIDTNLLVAAAFNRTSAAKKIIKMAEAGRAQILWSQAVRQEAELITAKIARAMVGKRRRAQFNLERLVFKKGNEVEVMEDISGVSEDPDDDKFLALAKAGEADLIISNDKHLLNLHKFEGIPIVKPDRAVKIMKIPPEEANKTERLDKLIFQKGLAKSRTAAQALIKEGKIKVGDKMVNKPSAAVALEVMVEVQGRQPYVSRAGEKLKKALEEFRIEAKGKIALDIGASTGGFTDCLLKEGARKVYAVDVGQGQLDERLKVDERVISMEGTDIRKVEKLEERVQIVTVDVSFISLKAILPKIAELIESGSEVVVLVKPQFEAMRSENKKGVIKSEVIKKRVIQEVKEMARETCFQIEGEMLSPIKGKKGNEEFFIFLKKI